MGPTGKAMRAVPFHPIRMDKPVDIRMHRSLLYCGVHGVTLHLIMPSFEIFVVVSH